MDDRHTILALLQLMQTPGIGAKALNKIIEETTRTGLDLYEFVALSAEDIVEYVPLKKETAERIAKSRDEAERVADKLLGQQIEVWVKGWEDYPDHLVSTLGESAPPVLFANGNLNLLSRLAVSFCGSRKASQTGLRIAAECAEALAYDDVNVVSGYAHGVDLAAHRGALAAGGVTTLVLAEGILHFRPKGELTEYMTEDNFLVLSEYPPRLPWSVHSAMQRNRTICGLADAMVLIESGLSGGTFEAGNTALTLKLPLFVVDYKEPPDSAEGNANFLSKGAHALQINGDNGPDLEMLWNILGITKDNPSPHSEVLLSQKKADETVLDEQPQPVQLPLFDAQID